MNIHNEGRRHAPPPPPVVRQALMERKPQLEPVIVPMPEANAAARALGGCIGCLEGEKLAIGLLDRMSGEIVALAVCSSPSSGELADQHTLEVRCLLLGVRPKVAPEVLWSALEEKAGQRGCRRLVMRGTAASPPVQAHGTPWARVRTEGQQCGDRRVSPVAVWAKVVRGDRH